MQPKGLQFLPDSWLAYILKATNYLQFQCAVKTVCGIIQVISMHLIATYHESFHYSVIPTNRACDYLRWFKKKTTYDILS